MLKQTYPYYLANDPRWPNADLEVTDKYSGKIATRVAMADADAIDAAIDAAVEAAASNASNSEKTNWRWRCVSKPASRSRTAAER